jgi:periplasmic divalent cation tolerance protein
MVNHSFVLCLTTIDSASKADELAAMIVKSRLGACVTINQVHSIYFWEDEIKKEPEYQLMIKTQSALTDKLQKFILENHSYDLPEVIFIPILEGASNYLSWITKNTV